MLFRYEYNSRSSHASSAVSNRLALTTTHQSKAGSGVAWAWSGVTCVLCSGSQAWTAGLHGISGQQMLTGDMLRAVQ